MALIIILFFVLRTMCSLLHMSDHSLPIISLKRMHYFSQFSSGRISSEFRKKLCLPTRKGSKTDNLGGPDSNLLSKWAEHVVSHWQQTQESQATNSQLSKALGHLSDSTLFLWFCGYFRVHLTIVSRAGQVWEAGFHPQTFQLSYIRTGGWEFALQTHSQMMPVQGLHWEPAAWSTVLILWEPHVFPCETSLEVLVRDQH